MATFSVKGNRRNHRYPTAPWSLSLAEPSSRGNNVARPKVVGAPVPRAEGPDKVTGRSIYTADVKLPNLLWGKVLRSPYPHARIVNIDTSRARQLAGVS